jgi:hypothetical protein
MCVWSYGGGGGVFKYFPYSIFCLFMAVEWILLNSLAPNYDFIPYRLTCCVICVSINFLLCA